MQELLREILQREGYRVTARGEAESAIEDVRQGDVQPSSPTSACPG